MAQRKTIAVANLKGGAGKTTASMLISTQLTKLGHTVTVLDMDNQKSAARWAVLAEEDGTPLPFEVRVTRPRSLHRYEPSTDFTFIDTPPGHPDIVDEAVAAADLLIVPTPPGFMDTDRTWEAVEAFATKLPTYVLMCRFDGRSNDARDFSSQLDERGVARFETVIPANLAIGRLRGTVPKPGKFRFDDLTTELLEVL